jgi:hypothetical protein
VNFPPASPLRRSQRESRGFALLITVTLLAFLVLLLVSLASLTRVETQVASNNQQIAQARQNALLALNIALGQLQKHAGPDQRVTARADVTTPPGVTVTAESVAADTLNSIDTYWRASRNRHWTGVWLNTNDDPATYDRNNPAAFNPVPALQSWLVSGNENTATTFDPNITITGLTPTSTPLEKILDSTGRPHRLLVKASANVTAEASLDRAVTAPEIEIRSTAYPGQTGVDSLVGHYAWWIGDEGIKARANLVDPYSTINTPEANARRVHSAQRPAIEAMTVSGTDGLASTFPANDVDLLNVFTPSQLSYLSSATTFPEELKNRFHDISVTSRGVLSDTKRGGLKHDLSYLLGQPNLADFQTALRTAYNTPDIAPLAMPSSNYAGNPLLNSTGTVYATLPSNPSNGDYANIFKNIATWEQLWSFHNMGQLSTDTPVGVFNLSGLAGPRRHHAMQHGIAPLVIQAKMFFRLRIVGGTATSDPDGSMVNHEGIIYVDSIPVVLLANPYAVRLGPADYQMRITGSASLVFGNTDNTTKPTSEFAGASGQPSYSGKRTFVLRSAGMAPGEAQIFTIDPRSAANPLIDAEDRILVTSDNDERDVVMTNEYDPSPALTYNTGKKIPTANSRAALRMGNSGVNTRLYMDFVKAQGDRHLVQFIQAQPYRDTNEFVGAENNILVVDPLADGIRQGGGYNVILSQPPTTDNLAGAPGRPSRLFSQQQAPFYQVNYRSMLVMWSGNSTYNHPLEWARKFVKNGSTGSSGNAPNPWIAANLLRPSGSTTTARWGIVNIGEGQAQTLPPESIGGPSSASGVGFNNLLYDIPRPGHPLASLGQLQHFNTTGFIETTSYAVSSNIVNSWQTNYPIANSYPQPRVNRHGLFNYVNNNTLSIGYHFDGSYLWNDLFWDRFTLSTYPQTQSFDFATDTLTNARYRPFRDSSVVEWNDETAFRGDGNPATPGNSRLAAQNLLVDGAFNINSTSVEAWKAIFSSLKNIPIGTDNEPVAPFTRTLTPSGGAAGADTGTSPNSWVGFRDLTLANIQALAEEMVMQIRKRGPFLSLSEFVNRRLISSNNDPLNLGLSGPLQAALDRVINLPANIDSKFRTRTSTSGHALVEAAYIMPTALTGFPGYVLQGDVLSALGSTLTARSDTFTIRTYGDSTNPATGEITGRAWCEAVVQRTPDYVEPRSGTVGNDPHETPEVNSTNDTFGRRFQIVSFRWLTPEDI